MKLIEHAMPSLYDNYMTQFIEFFVGALHLEDKSYLLDVFSGTAPKTNNAKKWQQQELTSLIMFTPKWQFC